MYEMDNDFNLIDVIDDPLSLNQFLEFPVYGSAESLGLDDVVPNATDEDFLSFDNCHLDYSSVDGSTTGAAEWNLPSTDLSSNVSSDFFDLTSSSTVGDQTSIVTPVATLLQKCETIPQNLPLRCISASTSNCSTPQSFVRIQPSRNNVNNINQLSGTIVADSSVQRLPNASNRVVANFAVANSGDNCSSFILNNAGSSNGSQVLMNVKPQSMVQNGPVRIQYIQVQNQLPSAMPAGTVVQSINATQLPANNLKPVQLLHQPGQQLVTHGIQGGINLQGTIIPTAAGNRILIRTGNNPPVPGASTGQVSVQPMQICSSNFVGATTQNVRLPQVIQQVTSVQQGVRAQHPQMTALVGRTDDAMVGQVIDANMSLSGGRQVVLQRTSAVSSQNLIYQQLPQQQAVTLPVNAISSQENKFPDSLVVQIGGQTYRFEPSRQSTGAANVRQNATFPQSQNVAFSDGGEILQDPVKMLQQNVQLQQVLLGNQINVLQMLQQQQQQQRLQPKVGVQPYAGSQVTGSCDSMIGCVEVTPELSGTLNRTALASQPLRPPSALDRTGFDPSIQGNVRVTQGLKPSGTAASHPGLQLIQPKPMISVGMPCISSAMVVGQPVNMLQLGTSQPMAHLGTQPTTSNINRNVVTVNVQPSAQIVTTLAGGTLQNSQNIQSVGGGQSQTVTAIRLSPDQQSLLVKIQSQMKTLLDLPKRNPDQEKYLQMLVSGQQRIISQGASQYLQQQRTAGVRTETSASGGNQPQQQQQQQQNVVMITQPLASVENGSSKISTVNSVACAQTVTSAVSSVNAVADPSASSNLQRSGNVKASEDLFQSLPHLKEKLEAHMAKMSPEQRQWFAKNQSLVFAKLQQHHHLLLEQDRKDPPLQQQPLASSKQQQNSSDTSSSSGSAATRVIRSLHLTRAQKFHLYLQKDQKRATHPEYSKTFENFKDVIRGLVPYHVFQTREPSDEEIATVEETFEEKSREMLERKDGMLRKYRLLLMEESMRPQLTSEMVLLERAFHSDEKTLLMNEKQQAEEDPDSFVPRPVLKRLKVDDELVKKEEAEESTDCKDKQLTCCAEGTTELTDVKVEAASLGANVVKLEHSSCPSSPLCPLRSSSSIERYKSLEIKLEKLDDADVKLAKCSNKIGKFDAIPKDEKSLNLLHSDNHPETNSCFMNSEIPVAADASPLRGSFSEDDVAVASLLNTESLKDTSCKSDEHYTTKTTNNEVATSDNCNSGLTFDKCSAGTLADSANAGLNSLSFANIANLADYNSDYVSFEREGDDLMRGTIDSLMADLTQFNYDLNNSSWGASEPKGGDVPSGSSRQSTAENTLSQRDSSATGGEERSTESLQYEMQCAIDSIIQLQQPWSEAAGMASDPTALAACSKVKNKESGMGGCLGKF